jgi:hypothetical protein
LEAFDDLDINAAATVFEVLSSFCLLRLYFEIGNAEEHDTTCTVLLVIAEELLPVMVWLVEVWWFCLGRFILYAAEGDDDGVVVQSPFFHISFQLCLGGCCFTEVTGVLTKYY